MTIIVAEIFLGAFLMAGFHAAMIESTRRACRMGCEIPQEISYQECDDVGGTLTYDPAYLGSPAPGASPQLWCFT